MRDDTTELCALGSWCLRFCPGKVIDVCKHVLLLCSVFDNKHHIEMCRFKILTNHHSCQPATTRTTFCLHAYFWATRWCSQTISKSQKTCTKSYCLESFDNCSTLNNFVFCVNCWYLNYRGIWCLKYGDFCGDTFRGI